MQGDQQVLMLGNGQRIENLAGKPAVKIIDFQEYGNYTGASAPAPGENTQAKLKSSFALLLEPTRVNLSELAWRIGLGLSAANFVLVALALGSVNPRGGRSGNMIFVLLSFVVYNNLLNLGQSWMNAGVVSFGVLMLAMHGGVALLAMTWLVKRHNNWTLRAALRSRPSPAAGGAA